jgi:hypothetical protein
MDKDSIMAHFAQIDENNKVTQVVVTDNNHPDGDEGYQFLVDSLGGTWIKTSYNSGIRKRFAGVGMTYDATKDEFIPIKPFPSWHWSDEEDGWAPPVPMPQEREDAKTLWNEESQSWQYISRKTGALVE